MTIEEFWNQAFLAALARLPLKRAKKEADDATKLCIAHWQEHDIHWAPNYLTLWKDQKIAQVPLMLVGDQGGEKAKTVEPHPRSRLRARGRTQEE